MNCEVKSQTIIREIYRKLAQVWGPQHWWPAETPWEVIVGAILTQNTSWSNVERAIAALRAADTLNMRALRAVPMAELEQLIRPSGYFRQKAVRLKEFVAFVDRKYGGSLEKMLARPTAELRKELLALKGIGPETADSILLYAGQHPIFVVDAYTRRVMERHGAVAANAKYDHVRELVESALRDEACIANEACSGAPVVHAPTAMSSAPRTPQAQVYNEMHGLFVQLGKHYCAKKKPNCDRCPLGTMLEQPLSHLEQAKSKKNNRLRSERHPKKRPRQSYKQSYNKLRQKLKLQYILWVNIFSSQYQASG